MNSGSLVQTINIVLLLYTCINIRMFSSKSFCGKRNLNVSLRSELVAGQPEVCLRSDCCYNTVCQLIPQMFLADRLQFKNMLFFRLSPSFGIYSLQMQHKNSWLDFQVFCFMQEKNHLNDYFQYRNLKRLELVTPLFNVGSPKTNLSN